MGPEADRGAGLELCGVSKVYPNGARALDGLDLAVRPGELLVLVGPSGSGKTTTLRVVAGLEAPSSGRVLIGGRDAGGLPPRLRDVAMVFQRHGLYPHLSVRENLAFPLALARESFWRSAVSVLGFRSQPSPGDALRIDEATERLGLGPLLDRWPNELSGGEQQRVALAKALVRNARILLLDEPLTDLDSALKDEARTLVRSVHRSLGCTCLYVTHDQQEALAMGDRVAVLNQGRVVQVDEPEPLYRCPRTRFVGGFIGWPAMNFLTGRLRREAGGLVFGGKAWSFEVLSGTIPDGWVLPEGPLVLGVRPEAVELGAARGLEMKAVAAEFLGAERLLTLERAHLMLRAKALGGSTWRIGQTVSVRIPMQSVNWFDAVNGEAVRLCLPGG